MRDRFRSFSTRFLNHLRIRWLKHYYKELDLDCYVSPRAVIWGSRGISLGYKTQIQPYATLQCTRWNQFDESVGTLTIGAKTKIQPHAYLHTLGGTIEIGENCSVNPFCMIYGSSGGLKIGNHVRIAAHTVIIPSNHNFELRDIPITHQRSTSVGITIEDDVWIGTGVSILDGVLIGTGCVIGAGSVVTRSTDPYGVYVGIPAKKINERSR
ncbi:MAG: acyltransferase [Anaerolineales bacterium]|jgi:acetyltransferase-like isoleucine patch superfamily enzyme|nr:acyltransferase [Anaerolineales bacterium]